MKKIILFFSWTGAFGIGVGWVSSVVWAQGAIDPKEKVAELPSIIKYSSDSPVDLLNDDPILPVVSGATHSTAGSGSIQRSISNRVPLPYYETGAPGNIAQFRGLGRSVEDTSVQALGVPLNYPQGGGFDLSIFPQFLWAGFQFQSGPSLGAFDPRAISGTVSLLPWTVDALRGETEWQRKFWVMGSSAGLQQTALGMARPGSWAAMLGMSLGKSVGPSGSFSIAFGDPKRLSGRFHLLATHLEVQNPGAQSFPTPNARSLTIRMIPVAQVDYRFSEETLYKGSVFIDGSYLRSNDPDSQLYSSDHAYQVGTENVLLHGNWRLGLNLRHLT